MLVEINVKYIYATAAEVWPLPTIGKIGYVPTNLTGHVEQLVSIYYVPTLGTTKTLINKFRIEIAFADESAYAIK